MKRLTTSIFRLAYRSLISYLPSHIAVLLSAATVTAVLTGALILGDSLRFSLRQRAVDRLGKTDYALLAPHLFRQSWVDEIMQIRATRNVVSHAAPVLLLQTGIEKSGDQPGIVNHVQVIGCDTRFWALGSFSPSRIPKSREIILNQTLADLLNAKVGDRLILRVPQLQGIPSESALGRRHELVRPSAVTVIDIIQDSGLGSFGLNLSQETPRNAFVDLEWLAATAGQPGRANLVLLETTDTSQSESNEEEAALRNLLVWPEDFGVRLERTPRGYLNLTTDRLIFDPRIEELLIQRLRDFRTERVTLSLAETVRTREKEVWYVTMAAMPLTEDPPLGPFLNRDRQRVAQPVLGECVVNEWLAARLNIHPGDSIEVTLFTPETKAGQIERQKVDLTVSDIVVMEEAANDPALVPEVQGLTDKDSIADWDPPFPFDASHVTKEDEKYWEEYRATPKVFVPPEFATKYLKSRFGVTTSVRVVPPANVDVSQLQKRLRFSLSELGWQFQPVRALSLEAARGTTPFKLLFLGFSMFVLGAAMILTGLVFAMTLHRRSVQIGVVRAIGWPPKRVFLWLTTEALLVAVLASLIGTVASLGYAQLMLWGLHSVWLPAIGTRFLSLSFTPNSLLLGFSFGVASGLLSTIGVITRLIRRSPHVLLSGQTIEDILHSSMKGATRRWTLLVIVVFLFSSAILLGLWGITLKEQNQAGIFFLSGATTLLGFWLTLRLILQNMEHYRRRAYNLVALAIRNLSRNRTRTELTTLLMAAAVFIIVAISAFYIDPDQLAPNRSSGNGGFAVIGETDLPVFDDFNDPARQEQLGFSSQERQLLEDARVFAFRVKSGQDASCLNLYRPNHPVVLGVSKAFLERGGFAFTEHQRKADVSNPWLLLEEPVKSLEDGHILVRAILDDATAKYSLHLWGGVGERFQIRTDDGRTVVFEIVGLLNNSVFQGKLLISEDAFLQVFPDAAGYRLFLIELPAQPSEPLQVARKRWHLISAAFERVLVEQGGVFSSTQDRLAALLAVQNTYLSTFQTLGGFGVLLGTVGLGAVLFRGLWERRREISLLRAVGFRPHRIQYLIILENVTLLVVGLVVGVSAALVAVFPQLISGRATIPWLPLIQLLIGMIIVGFFTASAATWWILRQNLMEGLRRE